MLTGAGKKPLVCFRLQALRACRPRMPCHFCQGSNPG
ncbi:MAG: hypothetical protein KatS3mg111_3821 [Pirellulaceae bacterium]|nr:MAG: hypothetical protein KatS3mg111_3821 [Pirellulaceae bacterium]